MRAKKAKAYRILTRQLMDKGVISDQWCVYGWQQHRKLAPQIFSSEPKGDTVFGPDGKEYKNEVYANTMRLMPTCGKAVYKRFKKEGIDKVLRKHPGKQDVTGGHDTVMA